MSRYINADLLIQNIVEIKDLRKLTTKTIGEAIKNTPTADVVDAKTVEQLKWERDMAIKQLESYGVGFCEKADVIKVKHGTWIKPTKASESICSECRRTPKMVFGILPDYCPHCGTKMDGERKE